MGGGVGRARAALRALLALAGLVTVASVFGRYFFADAIANDSEIVSNLTAMAVALFPILRGAFEGRQRGGWREKSMLKRPQP